jgi:adenylate cyclase
MRFRTKVFTIFLLLAVLSSSIVVAFLYVPARTLAFDLMRTNVLSVAATAAAMIDPAEHEKIRTQADQATPTYKAIEEQLRRARDANRRRDIEVKYMYSMRQFPNDPKNAVFVVDAEADPIDKSNVGDVYKSDNPDYRVKFSEYQADTKFVRDQWGLWLTANAPIRTPQGDTVGAVGVDVKASEANAKLNSLTWNAAIAFGISIVVAYVLAGFAANRVSRPLLAIRSSLERITAGDYTQVLKVKSKDEFGEVADALNTMTLGLQQREDLKSALSRYVSEDILTEIIYAGKSSDLYSQRKKVTALFADVRGFTALTEQVAPEQTVAMLNDYFEKMIDAIFRNKGHLNKFMGDGLMALFGALREDDFQEEHAIQAALDMRTAMKELQEKWTTNREHSGISQLRIGIGINTGLAIVGNIGSKQRMEFTAIGDSINLASRLEQATRDRENLDILVSEYTFVAVRSRFPFEPVGAIDLKGKSENVRTYTIKTT